jgi:hypothetical protein
MLSLVKIRNAGQEKRGRIGILLFEVLVLIVVSSFVALDDGTRGLFIGYNPTRKRPCKVFFIR